MRGMFRMRRNVFTVFTILCSRSFSSAIKVAILEKPLLVYLETFRQVAKIDHAHTRANTMLEYLHTLSLPEPFSFLIFLVRDSSSVSFCSAL